MISLSESYGSYQHYDKGDAKMQKIDVPAKDGVSIPTIFYNVEESDKKAIVIISHGFGEHSASYIELAETLWKAGYASVIPDQRGHGTPPEGVKSWHGLIPNYQCFIDDIVSVTEAARQMAPDVPIVLFGHSMGGNIVTSAMLKLPPEQAKVYTCAVLESPWFGLSETPGKLLKLMVKIFNRIAPNITIVNKLKHEDISSNKERAAGYGKDPLYHGVISMRMINGIFDACKYAIENADQLPAPVYLAYADNEKIVSNKAIKEFAQKAGDTVELKEYKSNHAIHNDDNRESYCRDIIAFLETKIG